jgi:hypothetical protein
MSNEDDLRIGMGDSHVINLTHQLFGAGFPRPE